MNDTEYTTTNAPMLCINCGFVGAVYWVNNIGPYCGRCSKQATDKPDDRPTLPVNLD